MLTSILKTFLNSTIHKAQEVKEMYGDILKINEKEIRDKIYACWCGKNIGGTLGAPYEGKAQLNDIKGFSNKAGEIIPNDDLDLQLAWLCAIEKEGPYDMSARKLGEYWIDLIPPHWGEYSICKANMRMGIMPSLSGEINNHWKESNGAWIRSEIWACMAPGFPQIAIRYACMDACVDHGMNEGTYAALFTTALESIAFRETDLKKIINEALLYIPEDSRIYKSVKYVIDEYEKGTDWKKVREGLMKMDEDIGTWQAPANVGYVIVGLLYGEGDFKKSLLTAVNCGDDTDCTAATIGSFLGILNGTDGLPEDWCRHIGDKIVTVSINGSYAFIPKDLHELTERVFNMMPVVLKANRIDTKFVDEKSDFSICETYENWTDTAKVLLDRSKYFTDGISFVGGKCFVEFDREPVIAPNETITGTLSFVKLTDGAQYYQTRVFLPNGEGWSCDVPKNIYLKHGYLTHENELNRYTKLKFSITAGETVDSIIRIPIEVTAQGRPTVFYIPIVLQGK